MIIIKKKKFGFHNFAEHLQKARGTPVKWSRVKTITTTNKRRTKEFDIRRTKELEQKEISENSFPNQFTFNSIHIIRNNSHKLHFLLLLTKIEKMAEDIIIPKIETMHD